MGMVIVEVQLAPGAAGLRHALDMVICILRGPEDHISIRILRWPMVYNI